MDMYRVAQRSDGRVYLRRQPAFAAAEGFAVDGLFFGLRPAEGL